MYDISNTIPSLFWGKETTSKMGRDPLAVQNSSVVIYSNVVRGITNVTARVRYNSFFCWLLTLIAERLNKIDSQLIDNPKEQIIYIRRGELLLAYEMVYNYPDVLSISGSIFAQNHIYDELIDLARGADVENKPHVYWQNSRGIFGQYYVGVLTQLRLLFLPDEKHHTYRVTSSGKKLGDIFKQSLTTEQEELIWNSIYGGIIHKKDLPKLRNISLHTIDNDKELDELKNIFISYDAQDIAGNNKFHRLETIKLLMHFIEGEGSSVTQNNLILDYLKNNFQNALNLNMVVSEESLSWFLYELNELSHAAYEAFHFAILYSIDEEPQPLDNILNSLHEGYDSSISNNTLPQDIYGLYESLQLCYKEINYGRLLHVAAQLLICLFNTTHETFSKIDKYAETEGYIEHHGYAPTLLYELVGKDDRKNDWTFIEYCILNAINDHLRSSYSKSSIGQGIVHNYMLEDGFIWLIRSTYPIRTSPRLQNVLQYIEDLKWIERKDGYYTVTDRGHLILDM